MAGRAPHPKPAVHQRRNHSTGACRRGCRDRRAGRVLDGWCDMVY